MIDNSQPPGLWGTGSKDTKPLVGETTGQRPMLSVNSVTDVGDRLARSQPLTGIGKCQNKFQVIPTNSAVGSQKQFVAKSPSSARTVRIRSMRFFLADCGVSSPDNAAVFEFQLADGTLTPVEASGYLQTEQDKYPATVVGQQENAISIQLTATTQPNIPRGTLVINDTALLERLADVLERMAAENSSVGPVAAVFEDGSARLCPFCRGPTQVVNQRRQHGAWDFQAVKVGCANAECQKYLRPIEERPPYKAVPTCARDANTKWRRVRRGRGESWQCPKHPREERDKVVPGDPS